MKNTRNESSRTPLSPLVLIGYFVILFVSAWILGMLPYPSGGLAWAGVAAAYAVVVGLACGVWWWFADRTFSTRER